MRDKYFKLASNLLNTKTYDEFYCMLKIMLESEYNDGYIQGRHDGFTTKNICTNITD